MVQTTFHKIKASLFNRESVIFLLFVIVSAGFWYFQNLYEKHEFNFHIPLTYSHIPGIYVSPDDLPATLDLTLADIGVTLLSYRFRGLDPLEINLQNYYKAGNPSITIATQSLILDIRRQLKNTTEIVKFRELQLIIPLIEQQAKTLPVVLNADISYLQQYILSGEITLTPNVVSVFGPKSIIDTLSCVSTQHIRLEYLSATVERQVPLRQIKSLRMVPEEITLTIPVETFTEQSIDIPVTGKNLPAGVSILVFPSMAKVMYFAALSHIDKIENTVFEVFFDYNDLKNNDAGRLPLHLTAKDPYLQNVRIIPKEVEYLIGK